MPPIINILISAIPIVGQAASEVSALIASLKAIAVIHGYDLDTQAIDDRIAEDTRRQQIALSEAQLPPIK